MGKISVISLLGMILIIVLYVPSWIFFLLYGFFNIKTYFVSQFLNVLTNFFYLFLALFAIDIFILKGSGEKKLIEYKNIDTNDISVAMPAYNEEKAITKVVKDFSSQKGVKEIIVVDNGSADRTGELARLAGAKVIRLPVNKNYGYGCYEALKHAKGKVVVLTESDASYNAADIKKFLPYLENVDIVLGTRTTEEFINPGAKMDWFLKWGNIFIAKLIQLRFNNRHRLTDVGYGFRAYRYEALQVLLGKVKIFDDRFSPHTLLLALKNNFKIIEVPVSYNERVGKSKITPHKWPSFKLGLKMIWLVIRS